MKPDDILPAGTYLIQEGAEPQRIDAISIETVMAEIEAELLRATRRFPKFRSAHEGEAIVREEMDELTQAVRHESGEAQYKEAKQVAAMAARFMLDIGKQGAERPVDVRDGDMLVLRQKFILP